jgi:hypothetical protein
MRSNPDFPAFNQALNASLNGDATGFAYLPIGDIRETVVVPLLCSDFRMLFFSFFSVKEIGTDMVSARQAVGNLSGFEAFNDLSVQTRSVSLRPFFSS